MLLFARDVKLYMCFLGYSQCFMSVLSLNSVILTMIRVSLYVCISYVRNSS